MFACAFPFFWLLGTRSPESARPSAKRNETLLHCVRLPTSDFRL